MGMFDWVVSDYPIFKNKSLNRDLQTDSLGKAMRLHYVNPYGEIFVVNFDPAFDLEVVEVIPFLLEVPNGKRGKISPLFDFSGVLRVFPSREYTKSAALEIENGRVIKIISLFEGD